MLDPSDLPNLGPIAEKELANPGSMAEEAAKNAVIVAHSVANLGMQGQDNTQLSRDLFKANLAQIEQIQKLYGIPANLPFQTEDYQPPNIDSTNQGQVAEDEGKVAAAEGEVAGRSAYELTLKALDESTAPAVFPLIGESLAATMKGVAAYDQTNLAAKDATSTAKAEYENVAKN